MDSAINKWFALLIGMIFTLFEPHEKMMCHDIC